jgi:hypothetical protein
VTLVAEIGDKQIEALLPLGEPFLVDGEDPLPKRVGWGAGKRRAPHLIEPDAFEPEAFGPGAFEPDDGEPNAR